jgi:hypothetical protein
MISGIVKRPGNGGFRIQHLVCVLLFRRKNQTLSILFRRRMVVVVF